MKNISFVLAGVALVAIATPALAQTAEDAVEDAMEAAEDAAADVAKQATARPVPPIVLSRPDRYPQDPTLATPRRERIMPADYPIASWNADEEGFVDFAVNLDAEGKPTSCSIVERSGFPALDERTCELMMSRVEYKPALAA